MEDLIQEYLEDLRKVGEEDDSHFPEFLFQYLSNDFEDEDYYHQGLAETPVVREAKMIRRKYSDYFDWIDAVAAYRSYIEYLEEEYGSAKFVKTLNKNGSADIFMPPKPRLKNTKKNRALKMDGVIPARPIDELKLTNNQWLEIARNAMPDKTGEMIDDQKLLEEPSKKEEKAMKRIAERISARDRAHSIYRRSGISNTSVIQDFLYDFIQRENSGSLYSPTYHEEDRPISELMEDLEKESSLPEELLEYQLTPKTSTLRNGMLSNPDKVRISEIYTDLYNMGCSVFDVYNKSMDKTVVKMVRNSVGGGPLTKKERKKAKKKAKQESKRLANKRNNDAMMERALLKNRMSFNTSGNEISFRMSDLIR